MSPFTVDTDISAGEGRAHPHGRMLLCTVYTVIQKTFGVTKACWGLDGALENTGGIRQVAVAMLTGGNSNTYLQGKGNGGTDKAERERGQRQERN